MSTQVQAQQLPRPKRPSPKPVQHSPKPVQHSPEPVQDSLEPVRHSLEQTWRGQALPQESQELPEPNSVKCQATFSAAGLERAFLAYCQLASPIPWPAGERQAKRLELLAKAVQYVHLPEFDQPDAEATICSGVLLEQLEPASAVPHGPLSADQESAATVAFQGPMASLCGQRVLTAAEESAVMRRLHYYKYLAARILGSSSADEWDLARAHALLQAAMWHRDLIVRANMRLVVSIVKKLPVPAARYDELISDGAVALLRAVDKFDPRLGYRFCTYATLIVRRDCFQQIELAKTQRERHPQADALATAAVARSDDELKFDRSHWLAWRKRLPSLMGNLSRREQMIIRSRFCLGAHRRVKTLQRLASALKISKERVRQIERSALAKLRRAAEAQA